jgi:2-dehydro-3-deoxyphosphogluconate aldolase/(4S)-4-hydroxy-2-oxoglutarate aldolase
MTPIRRSVALLEGLAGQVVAVVRAPSADAAVRTAGAVVAGGLTYVEIAFTTPDAARAIAEVATWSGVVIGAGTVSDPAKAMAAADAGAAFLVSPHTDPAIAAQAVECGLPYLPGALTPTEVAAARAIAPAVKLFPASLGGPSYLRALAGPFPDVAFLPTGGVTAGNVGEWLSAGALAVGAGGDLCAPALVASGRFDEIERRARDYAEASADARR